MIQDHSIPKTLCFFLTAVLICSSAIVQAQVDFGQIQPPSGEVVAAVATQDGLPTRWLATFENVPVFADSDCTLAAGNIPFRSEFFELWQGPDSVLLCQAERSSGGNEFTINNVVGYARIGDLISSRKNRYRGLKANNGIFRKALVVHRWEKSSGVAVTAEATLRSGPDPNAKKIGSANLFEFLYVYALQDSDEAGNTGHCLVGTSPFCEVADEKLHKTRLLGWLENQRVFFWDHREGAEFNKDTDAFGWRRSNQQPIRCFADEDAVRANQPSVEESLEMSDPWAYHVPRYPIISKKPIIINGVEYHMLGVIGDSYDAGANGGVVAKAALESLIREKLTKLEKNIGKLDVLFVIDATGSMQEYYRSIRASVGRIRKELQANRESPIRYSVFYYRDYSEEEKKDSWSQHFVDFVTEDTFARNFPHVESSGGQDNPPPLFAVDTAVKKATWSDGSMRVVILIGDMGNEIPDGRKFTSGSVAETLRKNQCDFFAIQAQPDIDDAKILAFNSQSEEIARKLGMPSEQSVVLSAQGVNVADAVFKSVSASNERAKQLREVLLHIQKGGGMTDSIDAVLKEHGISSSSGSATSSSSTGPTHGAYILQNVLDRLIADGIDPTVFANKRIQHFGIALSPVKTPGTDRDAFHQRVLMSELEFDALIGLMSRIQRAGVTPSNVAELWRGIVNQLSGDLDEEVSFDENTPLSEYMTRVLGIPVTSDLLKKSVAEVKSMSPTELSAQRVVLKDLYEKMNNFKGEMRIDGTQTERHWFSMRDYKYAWIPLEILP